MHSNLQQDSAIYISIKTSRDGYVGIDKILKNNLKNLTAASRYIEARLSPFALDVVYKLRLMN